MIHRKTLFFCCLVAVLRCSESSFVDFFTWTPLPPLQGQLGPSIPADAEYVPFRTCRNHFMLTRASGGTVAAGSFEECRAAAATRGAHAFWFVNGVCEVASLRYPLCFTRAKNFAFHVLQEYLSNGNSSDEAILTPDVVSSILGTTEYKSFRIESPTIADVRREYRPLKDFAAADAAHADNFVLLRDNGKPVRVDRAVLADPACHTNSTCGVPFFTSHVGDEDSSKTRMVFLHDVCNERFPMRRGQVYYLMSHSGIGCEPYPTTYPTADPTSNSKLGCSVLFRGFEQYGDLKAKITLVDFKGNDRCDGQNLGFLIFEGQGIVKNKKKYNACRRPVNEISTREGRIRITLSGSPTTTRKKYGFIIKISY